MLHILSYIYNMNLCKHVFIMNIQIYIYTVCITYIIVISAFHIYIYTLMYTLPPSRGPSTRTAFRRLALLVHPDKNPGEEEQLPGSF